MSFYFCVSDITPSGRYTNVYCQQKTNVPQFTNTSRRIKFCSGLLNIYWSRIKEPIISFEWYRIWEFSKRAHFYESSQSTMWPISAAKKSKRKLDTNEVTFSLNNFCKIKNVHINAVSLNWIIFHSGAFEQIGQYLSGISSYCKPTFYDNYAKKTLSKSCIVQK